MGKKLFSVLKSTVGTHRNHKLKNVLVMGEKIPTKEWFCLLGGARNETVILLAFSNQHIFKFYQKACRMDALKK